MSADIDELEKYSWSICTALNYLIREQTISKDVFNFLFQGCGANRCQCPQESYQRRSAFIEVGLNSLSHIVQMVRFGWLQNATKI